jgi:cyclic pyranopterin phosphate synthase
VIAGAGIGLRHCHIEQLLRERPPVPWLELLADNHLAEGGPARYLRIAGSEQRIGLITPISRHFCATCNRVRLTADGRLIPCLDDRGSISLADALYEGDDQALECVIRLALQLMPQQHGFDQPARRPLRPMAYTGG